MCVNVEISLNSHNLDNMLVTAMKIELREKLEKGIDITKKRNKKSNVHTNVPKGRYDD